jgi:hypothetical protein
LLPPLPVRLGVLEEGGQGDPQAAVRLQQLHCFECIVLVLHAPQLLERLLGQPAAVRRCCQLRRQQLLLLLLVGVVQGFWKLPPVARLAQQNQILAAAVPALHRPTRNCHNIVVAVVIFGSIWGVTRGICSSSSVKPHARECLQPSCCCCVWGCCGCQKV